MFGLRKKGYEIKVHGRAGLTYKEGAKSIQIDSEMLVGDKYDMVIYFQNIKTWSPPNHNETLSSEDLKRTKKNIEKSLKNTSIEWN